jgi:hypothetical protein
MFIEKPEGKNPLGRPMYTKNYNIKMDPKEMGGRCGLESSDSG